MNISGINNSSSYNHGGLNIKWKQENATEKNQFNVSGTNGDKKLTDISKEKNAELIQKLSALNDDEKKEVAVSSYMEMQSILTRNMIGCQKNIERFGALTDEIAYYDDLLEKCGDGNQIKIDDNKYGLHTTGNTGIVDRSEIEKRRERANIAIDNLVDPQKSFGSDTAQRDFFNRTDEKIFSGAAARFETVTGMTADCLNMDGDSSLTANKGGLTREDYVQKQTEAMKALSERSESLSDLFEEYKKTKHGAGAEDVINITEKQKLKTLETIRKQFLLNGTITDPERTMSRLLAIG